MEIKTKYNVGDKVWIMRNNKPEKIQISNIEVEVIGDVPVGSLSNLFIKYQILSNIRLLNTYISSSLI